MDSQAFWQVFLDTGAPEMFMLYNKMRKMEDSHVSDDTRLGSAGNTLQ